MPLEVAADKIIANTRFSADKVKDDDGINILSVILWLLICLI